MGDLLGGPAAADEAGMERQAEALLALGPHAVLLEGGHLDGPASPDLLARAGASAWPEGERLAAARTHGTGCTLSSALAAGLGRTEPPPEAARRAKAHVAGAIADRLEIGRGPGPLHHFHASGAAP